MPNGHPKPLALVRHHMSNEERNSREAAEKATKSGIEMRPTARVKKDKAALKEFKRIKALYSKIGQDDDMYSNMISDYCIAVARREDYYKMLDGISTSLNDLDEKKKSYEMDLTVYIQQRGALVEQYFKCEDRIQRLTKTIFDHERASLLGLADKMRTVPKTQEKNAATSRMGKRMEELKRRAEQG